MFAPLDDRIQTFHKGLYTSDMFGYEDPTYLGFTLHFDFDPTHVDVSTGITENALFAEPGNNGQDSAIGYLQNLGFHRKSNMLMEFKDILRFMNTHAPYYFQGISGVAELWKIEKKSKGFEPNRGHEKKIKIECLESIDLRITALADLYKSATFDEYNMRELVPENLRWFTVTLRIAEIRNFHRLKKASGDEDLDAAPDPNFVQLTNELISVVEFELGHCEFDFEESFGDEFKMNGEAEMAKQSFSIKVGTIKRKSTYKLLDLLIYNKYNSINGIQDDSDLTGGKLGGTPTPSDREVLKDVPLGSRIPGMGGALNGGRLFGGAVSAFKDQLNTLGNNIANAPGRLLAGATNNLQSRITGAALGNVYDIRNSTILENINRFLSGGDQLSVSSLGDVYPDVPGSGTTTKTANDLGNAYE